MSLELSIGEMQPADVILPLLSLHPNGTFHEFLGTGFFVGAEPRFVTALHNVEGVGEHFGIVHVNDLQHIYPASVRHSDPENDIAILEVFDYRPTKRLALSTGEDVFLNLPVICYEYGTTVTRGRETQLSAATRVGNITRVIGKLDILGRSLTKALEVSFPALRGASGAPILTDESFMVVGMIVGNMSYHLMPAQIETVTDAAGKTVEEVKYMLPLAIAVHAESLRKALEAA